MRNYKRYEDVDYDQLIDMFEAEEAKTKRLRALINGLRCEHSHGNPNWECVHLVGGDGKMCQACNAKREAVSDGDKQ